MESTERTGLTRQQLYEQVWSIPMRVLAPKYDLSDVGLAKVCKKYGIPRPPVGYWAKVEHGKKVRQPKLPPAPEGIGDVIVLLPKPPPPEQSEEQPGFFDEQLGAIAARLEAGDFVKAVASDLRGCSAITRQTREALEAASRPPTRDRWGVLEHAPRYPLPHIHVSTSKELRQRALLLVDALVKTFDAMGCQQRAPRDEGTRAAIFELRGLQFTVRVRERTKRVTHVLTDEEKRKQERYRYSFAPKYDYNHAGELFVELIRAQWSSAFLQIKDGKRAGLVEERIAEVALAVLRQADRDLERAHQEELDRQRRVERERLEREEAERRRVEEERRQAELACQKRLFSLAEDWQATAVVTTFLAEVWRRLEDGGLDGDDRALLQRWLQWGARVARERDPFSRPLSEFPEVTHPGIREAERCSREARARQKGETT